MLLSFEGRYNTMEDSMHNEADAYDPYETYIYKVTKKKQWLGQVKLIILKLNVGLLPNSIRKPW